MGEGKNLVGVDIGSAAVKVCHVRETRRGLGLLRLGYVPLPPNVIVDGQVVDAPAVIEALKRAFAEGRVGQKECALSVSGQTVIIRKIVVPMMTPAELDQQIPWEAEQHIPFDVKDVQIDYQVLRTRPEASQMDLLLVAAKRDQIQNYVELARKAKLRPVVCDIDAFTVQNVFEYTRGLPPDRTIALINAGASLASLNIVANGVSAFTREIASGGNAITGEIQRQLGVPYDVAESFKCAPAGAPDVPQVQAQQVAQIAEGVANGIAAEIQRSIDFYLATSGESEVAGIYLTGGSANLPALAQAIARRARVHVETWTPTERLSIEAREVDSGLLGQRAAQLAVAVGLGLRKSREARPS